MTTATIISVGDLVLSAVDTADFYLARAVDCIDARFGEGYAQKHPELIGAFMHAAAQDLHTAIHRVLLQDLQNGLHAVHDSLESIWAALP